MSALSRTAAALSCSLLFVACQRGSTAPRDTSATHDAESDVVGEPTTPMQMVSGAEPSTSNAAEPAPDPVTAPTPTTDPVADPTPTARPVKMKVYAHVMPWFDTPETIGRWGIHWTMNTRNPDYTDESGRRQIASYYYPVTGPYASSDADIVEYQLLLMRYSGITGVLVDWPGTIEFNDYPQNLYNSNALIDRTAELGLEFAIVYEDRNVRVAGDAGAISDWHAAARGDMQYIRDRYFSQENYTLVDGAPLLLTFGPQTFQSPSDWVDIFSVLSTKPRFLTLWYEAEEAGSMAGGEYAWIYENNGHLDAFYDRAIPGLKMGSAYPGYESYYEDGGWSGPTWTIPHDGVATFAETLDKAIDAGIEHLQIATWNDYGEGTMIEPTEELGFSMLTTLQEKLGVSSGEEELQLIWRLYQERKASRRDATRQAELDEAFDALADMRPEDAKAILE